MKIPSVLHFRQRFWGAAYRLTVVVGRTLSSFVDFVAHRRDVADVWVAYDEAEKERDAAINLVYDWAVREDGGQLHCGICSGVLTKFRRVEDHRPHCELRKLVVRIEDRRKAGWDRLAHLDR